MSYDYKIVTIEDFDKWNILYHGKGTSLGFKDFFSSIEKNQLSFLMGTLIEKIPLDIGSEEDYGKLEEVAFIERFGHTTMEKFQIKCISTIKMEINQTILLKIWNWLRQAIIQRCIGAEKKKKGWKECMEKQFEKLKFGMALQLALNGIENTAKKHFQRNHFWLSNALNAPRNFNVSGMQHCSALHRAGLKIDVNQGKTTKHENAFCANENLSATDIQSKNYVQSNALLKPVGLQDVYDLEVEIDHCYFANGILVSNSNYADSWQYLAHAMQHLSAASGKGDMMSKHKDAVALRRRVI